MLKKTMFLMLVLLCVLCSNSFAAQIHDLVKSGDINAVKKILTTDAALVKEVSEQGSTPLHIAADTGNAAMVELLLKQGAEINKKNSAYGMTALHFACRKGDLPSVRLLLENGADIQVRENDNETAMHYAALGGNIEIIKLLASKNGIVKDRESRVGGTTLGYAVQGGHVEAAKLLVELGEDPLYTTPENWTLLHNAAWESKRPMIEFLLAKGLPVNAKNKNGRTPLHNACMRGNTEAAAVLIEKGADVNAVGDSNWTPLYLSVKSGYKDIASMLLKAGANANEKQSTTGQSLLHIACIKGYSEIAAMLLDKNANANAKDNAGNTALRCAQKYGNKKCVECLLAKHPDFAEIKNQAPFNTVGLLSKPLNLGEAAVIYLGHSGWAVKTKNQLLVFDYFIPGPQSNDPSLANGAINPAELKNLAVTVFSSHSHADHYTPVVFDWTKDIPNITYVMGFKPAGKDGYIYIAPQETKTIKDMEVTAITSNDSGQAYFVKVDGVSILYSADHANRKQDFSQPFKEGIDFFAGKYGKADILFAPVSGCGFGDQVAVKMGVYYTIEKVTPRAVFPMHAANNEGRYNEFAQAAQKEGIKASFCCVENRGDSFVIGKDKIFGSCQKTCTESAAKGCCKN